MQNPFRQRFINHVALWYLKLDSELLVVGDTDNTEESFSSERLGLEVADLSDGMICRNA